MVEKRPYPGDHGASPNGVKRAKPATSGGPSAMDVVAAAKAKAQAKAAELRARAEAARGGATSNGTTASTGPPPAAASPGGAAADKLAAMKARLAKLKSGSSAPPTTDAPPVRAPPTVSNRDDGRPSQNESRGPKFATTLGNQRTESPLPPTAKSQTPAPAKQEETLENPYFDPQAVSTKRTRLSRGLVFAERGRYLDLASKLRERNRLEEIKKKLADRNKQQKLEESSERAFVVERPPDGPEWWASIPLFHSISTPQTPKTSLTSSISSPYLSNPSSTNTNSFPQDEGLLEEKTYDCIDDPSKVKIDSDDSIITSYIQHPALLTAPQDKLLVPAKPMFLTTKEQAKLRRMRRAEEHKEEQAKIRLGLTEPPPPKIKRGNMMMVLGEKASVSLSNQRSLTNYPTLQAIADPTAVEMMVESQIQERQDAHIQNNESRKLSKEARLEKLAENQQNDAKKGLYLCVFKITNLSSGKQRYQIDVNAKQHSLTGITLFNPHFNLVIVEGGLHSIAKYKKLLLSRIKWTENAFPTESQLEKQVDDPAWMKATDEQGHLRDNSENRCVLVFEGEVKQRAFRKWGSKVCASDGEAKEVLARSKLDSLWALAKSTEG